MIENEVVVEIDGKQHKNWKSYNIDSDFLIPADSFSFDLGKSSEMQVLPNFAGKTAVVKINGETILTGIVDTVHHRLSKNGRGYSLNGRDKASLLLDCSAPLTNVKGLTLLEAVKKIVEPLGIKQVELRAENNPTLDKIDIDISETAWEAIMRCANSAGLHCWFEPNGVLMIGGADYSSSPVATLYLSATEPSKNNISEANLTFDVSQSYSEVTFLAQTHGRENDHGKHNLKWTYQHPGLGVYKPKTVVLSDVDNLEALKKQAKKQIADWQLDNFNLTVMVSDHKTQGGQLWQPGQRVHIVIEEYDIDAIFFLMGRRFTLSRSAGTQTELRFKQDGIWTPDAYKSKADKARKRKGKKRKEDLVGSWELQ
ncbi:phage tail protein [Histophilus somni]|nr:phage tail protein [Histophilus somni]